MRNLDSFMYRYAKNLERCVMEFPDQYVYPVTMVSHVADRMRNAIVKRSFNKDSNAFKATCKELKIRHTYIDIYKYINGGNL